MHSLLWCDTIEVTYDMIGQIHIYEGRSIIFGPDYIAIAGGLWEFLLAGLTFGIVKAKRLALRIRSLVIYGGLFVAYSWKLWILKNLDID